MPTPPPTALNDPLLGAAVGGRFRIVERLGVGGFGVVYRADQLSVDRPVAIKVLGLRASGPDARKRFRREAQVLSRLTSPHTVRLIDFGVLDDGRFYYVMEYLEGQTLEALIARGKVPVDVALRIAEQICHALQEAHGQQVVHRDLKPANVWLQQVSGDRVVKLLDFGTARLLDGDKVTRSEVLIGTPAYLAPEQCRSGALDGRADLYALGLLMFEMIAGRHPFGEGVLAEMVYRHVHAPPPRLFEAVEGVPPVLSDLVRRLMAKDPADRPESAWAVRLELERLLAGRGSARVMGLAPTALYDVIDDAPAPTEPRAERSTRVLDASAVRAMADGPPPALDATVPSMGPDFRAAVVAGIQAPDPAPPTAADPPPEPPPEPRRARGWLVILLLLTLGLGLGTLVDSLWATPEPAPTEPDAAVVRLTIAPPDAGDPVPVDLGVDQAVDAAVDVAVDAAPARRPPRRVRPRPKPKPKPKPRPDPGAKPEPEPEPEPKPKGPVDVFSPETLSPGAQ